MSQPREYPALAGFLTSGNRTLPVQIRFATKFSLWAIFDGSLEDLEVDNLDVVVHDTTVRLGPCRALPGADPEVPMVWLIPVLFLHDLEALFSRSEVTALPLELYGLPLGQDSRLGIDPAFRDFLSDLIFGLNVYMAHLDVLDAECREELPVVQSAIQATIIARATPQFDQILDTWNSELVRLASSLSLVDRDHYGSYFRKQVWSILQRAPFLAQTNLKNQGRGDEKETQRMVYGNSHEGGSTFGKLLHKYSVGLPSSQATRNVLDEFSALLRDHLARRGAEGDSQFKVLSLTCGPILEQLGVILTVESCRDLKLTILGGDQQSLSEAAAHLQKAEAALGAPIEVRYLQAPIHSLMATEVSGEPLAEFDFIYSLGLLDSEGDTAVKAAIQTLYRWLRPGGELVLANVAAGTPSRLLAEYWSDSKLCDRTERQCRDLVLDLADSETLLWYDKTKVEMLLQVNKAARFEH